MSLKALVNLSDKVKAIIVLVLDLFCIGFLGFAKIYGWEIPTWAVITDMAALLLITVFGIEYIFPPLKKKS